MSWALLLLLPVAALPFATVHVGPRLGLALAAGLLGAFALGVGGGHRGLHGGVRLFVAAGLAGAALAGLAFLPVGPELRARLQPGVAGPVAEALALAGQGQAARPLALDPGRGLVEWAVFVAMVLVVGGTGSVVRNRPRARRLAMAVVLTGAAATALGLVQRWTGAAHVLWVTELPRAAGQPFFATFLDPNHAGVLLAAAAPLAVALLRDRHATARAVGGLGGLLALVGALTSGSRGAVVLLALGLGISVALPGGRLARAAVGTMALLGLVVLVLAGPETVAGWLTASLDPSQQASVARGYGDLWGGRALIYREAWEMTGLAPLVGVGPAGFDDAWRVVRGGQGFTVTDHAHQELLQAIIEHGWPSLLPALVALALVVRAALLPDPAGGDGQARLQAGFAGALVVVLAAGMYEFPLRAGALSLLAALSAGAVLGLARAAGQQAGRGQARALALAGGLLVLLGVGGHLGATLGDRGAFADPDAAILRGRQLQLDAGLARDEGWSAGGDPAVLEAAVAAFQQALWRRPVDRIALQELARVRYRQGRPEDAVQALLVATRVYPSLPWPWRDLARVRRALGDDVGAWEAWSTALSYDLPPDFPVDAWLAEALRGPGGAAVAALAALPPRADRWLSAARLVEEAGARDEAELLFQEAALLDPEGRAQYAFALLRWGRAAEALAALPEAPSSCGEVRARAEALRLLSRCEEALPLAERALAACGAEDRPSRLLIARTRLCLGDERAIGVLEALVREAPQDPGPRRSLAQELARRGRSAEALRHLDVLEQAGALSEADRALQAQLRP
ncbi:O-antigen ligase family protein [Myxococcota bacterium]|nr:O-antigen ligase family protein [Myxococcota bacterium]